MKRTWKNWRTVYSVELERYRWRKVQEIDRVARDHGHHGYNLWTAPSFTTPSIFWKVGKFTRFWLFSHSGPKCIVCDQSRKMKRLRSRWDV